MNQGMRQYRIDGLLPADYEKLKDFADNFLEPSPLAGVYWITIIPDLLTPVQKEHETCGPHIFGLELEEDCLSCEFLVRIKTGIKCDCMGYATPKQRAWLMDTVDAMLEKLDIRI